MLVRKAPDSVEGLGEARPPRLLRLVQYPLLRGLIGENSVPIGAHDHLDALYAKQRLLAAEAARLESERDQSDLEGSDTERAYILGIQIDALREESMRIMARISDVLERDLQR